jgi:3-oxoacyl-ACP reductase-like protein
MSLFTKIKDAIFGKAQAAPTSAGSQPTASPRTAPPQAKTSSAPQTTPPSQASTPSAAPQAPSAPVDIEAVLTQLQSQNAQKLNWRTSIVDLMKLVGLDSSLQNRKELAQELGYTGDKNDSAAMNTWLHKRVMQELAANGGKVPRELTD